MNLPENDTAVENNIFPMPGWKRGATAAERLYELAALAASDPTQFERFIVVWSYEYEDRRKAKVIDYGTPWLEDRLGLLELAKIEVAFEK